MDRLDFASGLKKKLFEFECRIILLVWVQVLEWWNLEYCERSFLYVVVACLDLRHSSVGRDVCRQHLTTLRLVSNTLQHKIPRIFYWQLVGKWMCNRRAIIGVHMNLRSHTHILSYASVHEVPFHPSYKLCCFQTMYFLNISCLSVCFLPTQTHAIFFY